MYAKAFLVYRCELVGFVFIVVNLLMTSLSYC